MHKKVMIIFFIMGILIIVFSRYNYARLVSNVPPDIMADAEIIKVLDDFEQSGWKHRTKLPIKSDIKNGQILKPTPLKDFVISKFVKGIPKVLAMKERDEYGKIVNQYVLGIEMKLPRRDYYEIELLPPKKYIDKNGDLKLAPNGINPILQKPSLGIPIPGIGKGLSVWVHGRGYDLNLYVRLIDWKGGNYNLYMGNLNYVGWRPIKIRIPKYIPQKIDVWPQNKFITLHSLIIKTTKKTLARERILLFFDHLIALVNQFNLFFDGMNLDIAGGGQQQGK